MSKIMVIGSISTDFVVLTDRRPQVGETVTGNDFQTTFGGKGANQAVASARLGGDVSMVGTVGTDVLVANSSKTWQITELLQTMWNGLQKNHPDRHTSQLQTATTASSISREQTMK